MKKFLLSLFALLGVLNAQAAWEKATTLAVGDVVVLAMENGAAAYEFQSISDTKTPYGIGAAYTTTPEALYPLTVVAGSENGTFALKNGDVYLAWSSANSLKTSETLDANSSWNVSFDTDGTADIRNAADNTRRIRWNAVNPRFACYTTEQTDVYLLKQVADAAVATPVISPDGGTFQNVQLVTLSCETEGVTIYYTTDGTDPTTESSVYSEALSIASTTTIKAIAAKESELSNVASATFTKRAECSTLAELLALENNTPFVFNGELIVVATPSSRYVYVKDSDNAALIYDATGQNTASLYEGYTIAGGWNGKVTIYNGLFELIPDDVLAQETGGAVKVEYPVVTAADITLENANKVVTLKGVTAYTAGNGKNGTFFIGETAIAAYNQFNIDMSAWVEGQTYDIVGAISRYNDNVQFQPISFTEAEDAPAATVLALTAAEGAYPAGNNFVNTWTSNTEPVVTVTASANNMDRRVTEHFAWYSGQAQSSTYTFRVPGGFMITAISLKAKANSNEQTVTIGETQQVFTTDEAKMEVSGLASAAVALTLTGSNTSLLISQIDVTVAEDPNYVPPIASVEELTNSKAYSLVVPRGALGVNAERLVATNASGNVASNFALINYKDKLYLYSIAAQSFIAKDGTLTATAPGSFTLKDLGGSQFQFFFGDNCMNVSTTVVINNWVTVDDGNKFSITPTEDFDATGAVATLESIFANTVVYEISDANGVVFTSEAIPATLNAEITELPADFQRAFCTYDVTPTTIVAGENTVKVTVNYTTPFTVSKDFDNATWYYATIRGNKYLRADESAKDASGRYQTNGSNGGTDEYKWAFAGNPYTGFIVMNRGIGAEKVLYAGTQPEFQALNAEDIKCFWAATANGAGFTLRSLSGATMYINDSGNSGNLGYWNSANGLNDAGGRWEVTAVPTYELAIADDLENGVITADKASYHANDEIQLNIKPAAGYRLKTLTVMAGENEVAVADNYTFAMPAANVTVSATFDKMVYIETDLTSQFPIDWQGWTGATNYVGWAAPQVTTNDGRVTPACERFDGGVATTGTVFKRTLSGLGNGTYRIELYGAAASTKGRDTGIDSEMTSADEGDKTAVYLYATTASGTVKQYIPAHWATDFNGSGIATVVLNDVVVTDGTVEIGMFGDKKFTNWHVIQIKGVTATVDADYALAPHVSAARAISQVDVPAVLFGEIEMTINSYDNRFETAQEYLDAIAALDAVVAKAKAYKPLTDILTKGEDYKAHVAEGNEAVAIYDAAIANVKAAYDAVTVEDFAAAIATVEAALPALAKAQTKAGADMTAFIVNPEINGADGWTCEKPLGGNGPLLSGTAFEYWAGNASDRAKASFDYYQVIENVPNGFYTISAEMYNSLNGEEGAVFSATSGVYASAGDVEVSKLVDVDSDVLAPYTTDQIFVSDGTLRIGVKNTVTPMAARWFVADNFKLTLVEPANPEPTNLDFAADEAIDNGVCTYARDMATNSTTYFGAQAVDGWTVLNQTDNVYEGSDRGALDQKAGAVYAYGTDAWLGGKDFKVPAEGPEGTNGKALGLIAVWGGDYGTVQYTQDITFAPGEYTLAVTLQNIAGTNALSKNLIGFIANDGTSYLATTTQYPVGQWQTEIINVSVDKYTNGKLSLGFQNGGGSAAAPHIFVDKVEIISDPTYALRVELAAALATAQATVEAKANVGDQLFQKPEEAFEAFSTAVTTQKAVADNEEATVEQLQAAITALSEATTVYAAAINTPNAEKQYTVQLKDTELFLGATDGIKLADEPTTFFFEAVEGGYALKAEGGYVAMTGTGSNVWSMGITENPYAWTISILPDGSYTIAKASNAAQMIGINNNDPVAAGTACYADKTTANGKVYWMISEYEKPAVTFTVTPNIEAGTQEMFTTVETGSELKLTITAENLEVNGYNPADLTVKVGMLFAGCFSTKGFVMGTNQIPPYMKQNIEVPFAEEITLADDIFGTEYPFIQSIRIQGISLMKGEEVVAQSNEVIVIPFIEVYENGLPVGINGIQADGEKATIYDLSGRKVEKMVKGGVYIVNGKKVSFK